MKMLWKETRTAMDECKEACRVHKICRYKRKEYEVAKLSVETYNTRSESRKIYQEVRRSKEAFSHSEQYAKTRKAVW